jgi:hypothetical protein
MMRYAIEEKQKLGGQPKQRPLNNPKTVRWANNQKQARMCQINEQAHKLNRCDHKGLQAEKMQRAQERAQT